HEAARAEAVALVELEPDRLIGERRASPVRRQQHARCTGAQRCEVRLAVARALGEDEDVAATAQVLGNLLEDLLVLARILARVVLAPMDRNRASAIEQPLEAGNLPQRRLRDRRDL